MMALVVLIAIAYLILRIGSGRDALRDPATRARRFFRARVAAAGVGALAVPLGFVYGWFADGHLAAVAPFWVAALGLGFLALPEATSSMTSPSRSRKPLRLDRSTGSIMGNEDFRSSILQKARPPIRVQSVLSVADFPATASLLPSSEIRNLKSEIRSVPSFPHTFSSINPSCVRMRARPAHDADPTLDSRDLRGLDRGLADPPRRLDLGVSPARFSR